MTLPKSLPHERKILAFSSELLGIGGIQEAGRFTAQAVDEIALECGWSVNFLSVNEHPGAQGFETTRRGIPFSLIALRHAREGARIVLAPEDAWQYTWERDGRELAAVFEEVLRRKSNITARTLTQDL